MSHIIKKAPTGGGVPDEAYQVDEIRILDWSFGAYDSSVWDLGTGGYALMKWRRVGRTVDGWISIGIASDATTPSGFFIIVHPDDLPYPPKAETLAGVPMPGGFGVIVKADTAGTPPYNGFRAGISPLVQDITLSNNPVMIFFLTDSDTAIPSGADNAWSPVSNTPVPPANLKGSNAMARFVYEAANAA